MTMFHTGLRRISACCSTRFGTVLLPFLVMTLLLQGTAAVAAPAAGTVIGNQATATYVDSTSTTRTTSSNLVQTTVSQVKSFTLTANGSKTAAPGQTVYYPHTITNSGNGIDTYALNPATAGGAVTQTNLLYYIDANGDGIPDNNTPITSSGPIPAGTQFNFVAAGTVPGSATAGQSGTITISVSDTSAGGTPATNLDTTTVANSVINVTKSLSVTSGASPSGPIDVKLSYTNSGTLDATSVVLTDALPSGMTYRATTGRWSTSGSTALTDAAGGDPAGIDYGYTAGSRTITATITTVPAGTSGYVTFQIDVNGGLPPTTASNTAATTNTATFATSTQTSPSNTNAVTFRVAQSIGVVANGSSSSNIQGTAKPVTVASAAQGATITFTDYIWNTGNGADTFNLSIAPGNFPVGTTFALFQSDGLTSLLDSNGDGIPDTGPIGTTAPFAVVVRATLPANAPVGTGPYDSTLTAASVNDPTKVDTIIDRLTAIAANTVDLTNNAPVGNAGALGTGATGATVVANNTVTPNATTPTATNFSIYVNNTSGVADSYALSLTTALPVGYSVTFAAPGTPGSCATTGAALTDTGPLAAGSNRLICAIVNAPAINSGNAIATTNTFSFQAQSIVTPSAFDVITDSVTVSAVHALSITPIGSQQTLPGNAVTYTHTVTNNGNVNEPVTFPGNFLTDSQVAAGWTSTAYIDNGDGVLQVGTDTQITSSTPFSVPIRTSVTLFIRVFAPASATAASPADQTTLTLTYNGGASTAAITDTTSVTDGLFLKKEQATTPCGTVPSAYSIGAITASPATAPGQCIGYRITATNTSAASISSVLISDIVPANTTRIDSCGTPTATGGATVGGSAPAGGSGTVTASLSPLAPGASFQLTFCARINP